MTKVDKRALQGAANGQAVTRRTFAAGALALALAAAPGGAWAQQKSIKRIGYLSPGSSTSANSLATLDIVKEALAEHGWVEGRDVEFIVRFSENQNERMRAAARELVALAPDLLIGTIDPAQSILHDETRTIPIVFGFGNDPVGMGLAASHNRPGGNVTGVMSNLLETFMPKRLQFAHELLPHATRIALPFNASNPGHVIPRKAAEDAASLLKLDLIPIEVRGPDDLDDAFNKIKAARAELVVVVGDNLFFTQSKRMGALAAAARLPLISATREEVRDGAIMSYGANVTANYRRMTYFVDRILRGAKAADLPVEFPTTFDLVVNLKVAQTLGITIPDTIMILATEVIEE